ncbi:MAG: quaternary amine ABC transporter ATP-binding protein [Gammaproteobacteria bacterium]
MSAAPADGGTGVGALPAIRANGLWKVYGPHPQRLLEQHNGAPEPAVVRETGHVAAVRDVSLDIAPGEMLVVMGLSGSGKSTLVRCLSRLVDASAGQVEIEGRDLLGLSERQLIELRRSKMGMVFQNFALLPHRTVLDNVAFPLQMRGQSKAERRRRALEVIDLVGLEGREDHFPRELSGGQQQRVGIARSLAIEPDIWFLDEPFSALDPLIRREMQDEFLRLQSLLGKTIVFITHDFDEALRLADRIAIMYEGAIEQVDTPDRIVLEPATEYVAKFVRDVAKARVVHAAALARPPGETDAPPLAALKGEPVAGGATIASLGQRLVTSDHAWLPVADEQGNVVAALSRREALSLLVEEGGS